jgi:hypothetical protein
MLYAYLYIERAHESKAVIRIEVALFVFNLLEKLWLLPYVSGTHASTYMPVITLLHVCTHTTD